jgi:fructokinase
MHPIVGGVELGGTKVVCAVGTGPDDVQDLVRFPTTTPEQTLGRIIRFFRGVPTRPATVGIASFGPLDPDPASPGYGFITRTPKPGWGDTSCGPPIAAALGVPIAFDTDVNAAALGEYCWGATRDVATSIYLTVGTGIGGGALVNGRRLHGLLHPEMGHLLLPRIAGDDFPGNCPFHGRCLEGLASGTAIQARWGRPGEELPADHPAWAMEAAYLAMGLVNLALSLSPQRIVVGGGVMRQPSLLPSIRRQVSELLNGYVQSPAVLRDIEQYIVAPALGDRAGVLGAFAMAQELAG